MGTNYYWHREPKCEHCGRHDPSPLHVGKSSAGWAFGLRVHPDMNIESLDDWRRWWRDGVIYDEYGCQLTPDEMLAVILNRECRGGLRHHQRLHMVSGCAFELDVREGGDTYDLCNYDFS